MVTNNAANNATAASGAVLQGQGVGTASAFSTATYPATTTVSQILYSSATNTVTGLATGNDGVLITSHTGVPSILANGTTGQFLTATTGAPPSWSTSAGTGNVVGPGSATDNAFARYDGTTGLLIQNSGVISDDSNNVSGVNTLAISGSGLAPITVTSTDAGATTMVVEYYRNSASPAASDILTSEVFYGVDSAANKQEYAEVEVAIISTTSTAEKGRYKIKTVSAGTVTDQLVALDTGCQVRGNNTNTAPPAGYIGEQIVGNGTTVSLGTSGTVTNVTSISVTAGIWNIDGMCNYGGTLTAAQLGISVTSATLTGTLGQDYGQMNLTATGINLTVPAIRATLSTTTTYYLIGVGFGTPGNASGRITATRVG